MQMTLDHFSSPISHVLYQCFGFFSAAEGFFFLSGFVGMLATISKTARGETTRWMQKRAFRIWIYHIVSLLFLVSAALFFFPRIQHFFVALYAHPFLGAGLSAVLVHTPEWLDVLPLYVILLALASFIFPRMLRGHFLQTWAISFALWILAQFHLREFILQIFPDWIYPGFFDFFAWQFVYMTGASAAILWKKMNILSSENSFLDRAFFVALPFCIFCLCLRHFIDSPILQPSEFLIAKDHVGLLRFANFLAFVCVISFLVRHKPALLDFGFCRILGRHSLEVYSLHTIGVYLWIATPAAIQYHLPFNVLAPIFCCCILVGVAALLERQNKSRHK